jgi:DNA-binding response OmpR family regulator
MEKQILIADDSEELREYLRNHFLTLGYRIITAAEGEEVMRILETEIPDLLILDVMMPNPNGFQICRRIKSDSRFDGMPVVMLTARSRPEDVFWGKDCGADEYITKPFRAAELEARVEKLLANRPSSHWRSSDPLRWTQMKEEIRSRNESEQEMVHCVLKWNDRAVNVFRKKYGEVKFGEAMERIFEILRVLLRGEDLSAAIEFRERNGIQLLVQAERARSEDLAKKIAFHLNHLLLSFYNLEDLERGGVVFQKYGSKRESRVPLVQFDPTLNFLPGC